MAASEYYDHDPATIDDRDDQSSALAVRPDGEIIESQPGRQLTAAEAKQNAVAAVTMTAYARAGELKLTPEEDAALAEDFPDEAFRSGAGGDSQLIYIEHAHLRDRLTNVLGRGAWSLVTRSRWTEEYKTGKGERAVRVYSEVMLVVRGCFVSEAIGEMTYYPHNQKTTYADAIEGSKTAAFRRCAKDFSIGMQAWKKGWTEGWWQRNPTGKVQQSRSQTPKKAAPTSAEPEKAQEPAKTPAKPSDALLRTAEAAAKKGLAFLSEFWEGGLTKEQRIALKDHLVRLKADALAKDKEVEGLDLGGDAKED